MISVILSIISSLFTLTGKIFDYLYARQMVDAGKTAQQLSDLKGQIDAAHKAVLARLDVERDSLNKPDSVSVNDGFQRPD